MEKTTIGLEQHIAYCIKDDLTHFTLAIVKKDENQVIGWIGFAPLKGSEDLEIFYAIARAYWGNGFASEAVELLINYVFNNMGIDKLVAIIDPDNVASQRVVEKSGMVFDELVDDPRFRHPKRKYSIKWCITT